jgi:EmrB/QacA subfamily drug resistance transporter
MERTRCSVWFHDGTNSSAQQGLNVLSIRDRLLAMRRGDASPALSLAIVCAGVVLASLDLFIVNVALPDMGRELGGELSSLSWVLNGYAIVYAALFVLFGRISDRYSRRSGFLLGVAVFTLASVACGAATSVAMLVGFRVVQAAGAALLTPASLGLVLATSAPERRQSAVRAWTAVGGAAAALGPVVGGPLVAVSWRWVFLVNVPVGIAALIVGWRRLPEIPGHPIPRPDLLGALLVTGGVGALALGLVKGGSWGWGSTTTITVLAVAVVAIAMFVVHCLRHHNPLVDPALFRIRAFSGASVVATIFSMAFGAMLLSIVLWEQGVWGWSALKTGLSIAPGPFMVPVFSFLITGRAIARFGAAAVSAAGSIVFAGGVAWWALAITLHPDYAGGVLGGMLLTGIGVGLTLPTYLSTAAASLPPHAFAVGSAVVNMLRQVGLAVGVAVLIAILGSATEPAQRLSAFQRAWTVIAATAVVSGIAGAFALARRMTPSAAPAPALVIDAE